MKERGHSAVLELSVIYNTFNFTHSSRIFITVRNPAITSSLNFVLSELRRDNGGQLSNLPSESAIGGLQVDLRLGSWATTSTEYEVVAYLSTGDWSERVARSIPTRMAIEEEYAELSVPPAVHKAPGRGVVFSTTLSYSTGVRVSNVQAFFVVRNLDDSRGFSTTVVLGDSGQPLINLPRAVTNATVNISLGSWSIVSSRYTVYVALSTMNGGWSGRFLTSATSNFAVVNSDPIGVVESLRIISAPTQLVRLVSSTTIVTILVEVVTATNFSIVPVVRRADSGNTKYVRSVTLTGGGAVRNLAPSTMLTQVSVDIHLGSWATVAPGYRIDVYLVRDSWSSRFATGVHLFDLLAPPDAADGVAAVAGVHSNAGAATRGTEGNHVIVLGIIAVASVIVCISVLSLYAYRALRERRRTRTLPCNFRAQTVSHVQQPHTADVSVTSV